VSKQINLFHLEPFSQANGPGKRSVVWVQGCSFQCPGCANQHLWPFIDRELISVEALFKRIMEGAGQIEGVTFSGGEPFLQAKPLAELAAKLKSAGLSIVCFTGFKFEDLESPQAPAGSGEFLDSIDLLIDGKFEEAKKTDNLPLCGSANQVLHFLSDRHKISDVISCPKSEVRITDDGTMETGFGDNKKMSFLLRAVGINQK
jgi:anaerobic ribonucleoside-triphosphate reductase activating protein